MKTLEQINGESEGIENVILKNEETEIGKGTVCEEISEIAEEKQKQLAEVIEETERSPEFYDKKIDFNIKKWSYVWVKDREEKRFIIWIIRKVFESHQIVSPNDLRKFLGNDNPTRQEWEEFIDKLNVYGEGKLKLGRIDAATLLKWMRENKMIPIIFRKNI